MGTVDPKPSRKSNLLSVLSLVALAGASVFAGVKVAPLWQAHRAKRAARHAGPAEQLNALEHAAVDLRLGRGADSLPRLEALLPSVKDPSIRARFLDAETEAAVQAGRLELAERATAELEQSAPDAKTKRLVQLRHIGLLGAMGKHQRAQELAESIIREADSPELADEARFRMLTATQTSEQLRKWVEGAKSEPDLETSRRMGLVAQRALHEPERAARLLEAVARASQSPDRALYAQLLNCYLALNKPADVARTASALAILTKDDREQATLRLVYAHALEQTGDLERAMTIVGVVLGSSHDPEVRLNAKRMRFQLLERAGRLKLEIANLEKRGDRAQLAFIALEVQHDYPLAERLYGELSASDGDSLVYVAAAKEATRRKELAERRALYEKVLKGDPNDKSAQEKWLSARLQLGEIDGVRETVRKAVAGREKDPDALLALAMMVARIGLGQDASGLLERAYAIEPSAEKKQQILMVLGQLYAEGRQDNFARDVFVDLAAQGLSREIRDEAVARLGALLGRAHTN
jgi:hypothetical protein